MTRVTGRTIIACAGLAVVCTSSAQADPPRKLLAYGDSFAVGTKPYLPEALSNWRVSHDVDYSRKARSAPRALRERGARLPPVIHISLGTVDDPSRPRRFRRAVRRTMRVVGDERCVVWANIVRPMRGPDGTGYNGWEPLNRVLVAEALRRENLVIADWASLYRAHPEWVSPVDGTHVDERGYKGRAQLVAHGAYECYERLRRRGTS